MILIFQRVFSVCRRVLCIASMAVMLVVCNACNLKYDNSVAVIVDGARGEDNALQDFYVYPVPMSTSAVAQWRVMSRMHVKLSVRAEDWRLVEVLLDADVNGGQYTTDFRPTDKANGVYYFVLESPRSTQVVRALLTS